jgi:hypothetical protein
LRPVDRYLRAPIGFLWFLVLMILALPVMTWMTGVYYVVRMVRGGKSA